MPMSVRTQMLLSTLVAFACTLLSFAARSATPSFVENQGQWDAHVQFRADISGGVLWGDDDALTFLLLGEGWSNLGHDNDAAKAADDYNAHAYRMQFVGAQTSLVSGDHPQAHYVNYYIGNDPSRWAQGVRSFEQMRYFDVWQGIDVLIYGKSSSVKYDFKVAAGADPNQIAVAYDGLDNLQLRSGQLIAETSVGRMTELTPYAYQLIDGKLVDVECAFVLENNTVRYALGDYNPNHPLTIDPEIVFSTFVGSVASNFGFTATDDPDGNLVAGSCVFQTGYPTTTGAIQDDFSMIVNGNCDVGVSKFSADGSQLLYSTYLGGEGLEMPHSVISDEDGNYTVMGTTGSTNFPVTAGAYQPNLIGGPQFSFSTFFINASHQQGCDFFVTRFNGDDSGLLASTYIGGSDNDGLNMANKLFYNYGDSFRGEVINDEEGNVIVASTTLSPDFPMGSPTPQMSPAGAQDGIVFYLSADLTELFWSTYIGGSDDDATYSVQLDSNGGVVVCGGTRSGDWLDAAEAADGEFNGDVDAYILRFSADGSTFEGATFFGTPGYDQAYFVQLDQEDHIYILGQTDGSPDIVGDVYANPGSGQFIARYDTDLTTLEWLTTVGTGSGAIDISPTAFLVSDCDQIYLSGWGGDTNTMNSQWATQSTTEGLPLSPDAYQSTTDGSDFWLAVLSENATDLVYATYFGGDVSREHVDGGTSKFDKNGSVYQAVCAGCGGNSDFPSTPGAWSDTNPSVNCNLGVFKFDLEQLDAEIDIDGPLQVCEGQPAPFVNSSTGGDQYEWDFGDGNTSNEFEPQYVYESNGTFEVSLTLSDSQECIEPDTAYLQIEVLPGVNPSIAPVDPICEGESVTLEGNASAEAYWIDDPTLSATDTPNPVATPTEPTTYYLVDLNDCESDTVSVFVDWLEVNTSVSEDVEICIGQSAELEATGGAQYQWSPNTALSDAFASQTEASPTVTTTYVVNITTAEGCEASESVTVTVYEDFPGGNVYDPVQVCTGYSVDLTADDGLAWSWSPAELCDDPNAQTTAVTVTENTTFTVFVTNACGSGEDQVDVEVIIPTASTGPDTEMCFGESAFVSASGGESYAWQPSLYVDNPNSAETTVSPPDDQTFTVAVTDEFGCTAEAEVFVNVLPLPYVEAGPDRRLNWLEWDNLFGTADGDTLWWEPEIWLSCTDCEIPVVTPEEDQWYTLWTIDANGCRNYDSTFVEVFNPIYVPNTFTPNNDGVNDLFRAEGVNVRGFKMEIRNRWGELIFATEDIEEGWDGSVERGDYYVQIDTYIWTIWYDTKDQRVKLTGHVNVIR
jgi:gliding motility-associated-like protein